MNSTIRSIAAIAISLTALNAFATDYSNFFSDNPVENMSNGQITQCVNENLKQKRLDRISVYVGEMIDRTDPLTKSAPGPREIIFSQLLEATNGTNIGVIDLTSIFSMRHKSTGTGFEISGAVTDVTRGASGSYGSAAIYTRAISLGFGKDSGDTLIQVDFRLINSNSEVVETASFGTIYKATDGDIEGDAGRKSVLAFEFGRQTNQSQAGSVRQLVDAAAKKFIEKMTNSRIVCYEKYGNSRRSHSQTEMNEVVTRAPKKKKSYYFPRSRASSMKCRKRACRFDFPHTVNREMIAYAETALSEAYKPRANVRVKCYEKDQDLECRAKGTQSDLATFDRHKFKRNLFFTK